MTASLHPKAERDLADAFAFYLQHAGPAVAERLIDEFDRASRLLGSQPSLGTPTPRGRRTFPLRIFPYSIVYREVEEGIRILVVRHQSRRPGYGSRR